MQRLMHELRNQHERGASAIVVAITLMVMLGFAGFGIDVTSAYAKSQEVQNAADAAALATAQHCAVKGVVCSDGSEAPEATDLAQANVRRQVDTVSAYDTYPASNRVTVEVTAEHENIFAGLFGFNSFTVVREATAEWEQPSGGPVMLPLTISACSFYDAVGEPVLNKEIAVWLPKGKLLDDFADDKLDEPCGTLDYPPGGFGWLDHTNCQTDAAIGGWVDGDNGADRPSCLASVLKVGETFLLPIFNDIDGQGSSAEFQISRFAAMELLGYHFKEGGSDLYPPASPTPKFCPEESFPGNSDYRDSCLYVKFVQWVEIGDDYIGGGDEDSEVAIIRLIDPDFEPAP